jgi:hypothetical protein
MEVHLQMKRKGQIQDLILLPVILFVLLITVVFLLFVVNSIRGAPTTTNTQQQGVLDSSIYAIKGMDSMNVFIFIVLLLMIGGLAYAVRSSPIGIIIVLFIGMAVVLLSGMFTTMFNTVASDSTIVQSANSFPLSIGVFGKMGIFVAVGVMVILVLLFGKPQVV